MWRPERWTNEYKECEVLPQEIWNNDGYSGKCIPQECQGNAFEQGADAMLKALMTMGKELDGCIPAYSANYINLICNYKGKSGILVFIPDEE